MYISSHICNMFTPLTLHCSLFKLLVMSWFRIDLYRVLTANFKLIIAWNLEIKYCDVMIIKVKRVQNFKLLSYCLPGIYGSCLYCNPTVLLPSYQLLLEISYCLTYNSIFILNQQHIVLIVQNTVLLTQGPDDAC